MIKRGLHPLLGMMKEKIIPLEVLFDRLCFPVPHIIDIHRVVEDVVWLLSESPSRDILLRCKEIHVNPEAVAAIACRWIHIAESDC